MSITIGGSVLNGQRDIVSEASRIVRDFQLRAVNEEEGTIEAVVSTRDVDRYSSIILPSSIDRLLSRFLANPMFLWQHNRGVPIGSVSKLWRDEDKIYAVFRFDMGNPFAADVFRLYKEKVMRAFSISGRAHQLFLYWQSPKERADLAKIDEAAYDALDAEECDYVITDLELFEISAVTIPGNQNALSRAVEDGWISEESATILRGPEEQLERKETDMDRIPKELIERMDAVTKAAGELLARDTERAAVAPAPAPGLTDEQRAEVRQTVLDTLAEVLG